MRTGFWAWLRREIRLWKLSRDMSLKRQVWLDTRLLVKHGDEYIRHKKSSLAFLDHWRAATHVDEARKKL